MKNTIKILSAAAAAAMIICACVVPCFARSIVPGDKAYICSSKFCCEGAAGISTTENKGYVYERINGQFITLRMMYLASDKNGTAMQNDAGESNFVYCISYGDDLCPAYERTACDANSLAAFSGLPQDRRDSILLALKYGYPSNTYGVSAADAYAATQAVIWELQTGIRDNIMTDALHPVTYKGKTLSADRFGKIMFNPGGVPKAAFTAYCGLISAMRSYLTVPSFAGSPVNLAYNDTNDDYEAVLHDSNGVMKDFDVNCSDTHINVSVNGNDLKLSSKQPLIKTQAQLFVSRRNAPAAQALTGLFTAGAVTQNCVTGVAAPGQTVISALTTDIHDKKFKAGFLKTGETCTEYKQSQSPYGTLFTPVYEDRYISGAKAEITADEDIYSLDGTLIYKKGDTADILESSSTGAVYSKELYKGRYIMKETCAPAGYITDETEHVFYIDDKNTDIEIKDGRTEFTVNIKKIMDSGCENVVFGVFTADEDPLIKKDSLVQLINISSDGEGKSDTDLCFGKDYYLKELKTAPGYILDETGRSFDTKDANKTDIDFDIVNYKIPAVTVPDEPVPGSPFEPSAPKTYDSGTKNAALLTAVLTVSASGMIFIIKRR